MTEYSYTTVSVAAAVYSAAARAYLNIEPVNCEHCGSPTNTRDGYPVETPFGEIWICTECNLTDALWDPAQVFFIGEVRS